MHTKPKLCSWVFRRILLHAILHSFLNTTLLYYPYFQSESIWSQTHRKQESIYFIVNWHFMNSLCPCSYACLLHNNENLFHRPVYKTQFSLFFLLSWSWQWKGKWHLIFFPSRRLRFSHWVGKIPCRRKWQPIPVFLPGKSHEQRSPDGLQSITETQASLSSWAHMHVRALCWLPSSHACWSPPPSPVPRPLPLARIRNLLAEVCRWTLVASQYCLILFLKYLKKNFFSSWSIVDLQYLRYTAKWFNCIYISFLIIG